MPIKIVLVPIFLNNPEVVDFLAEIGYWAAYDHSTSLKQKDLK